MTDVGDLVRFGNSTLDPLSLPFTNVVGTATDPTTVSLVVRKPDGTLLQYAWPDSGPDGLLTKESTGRFYFDIIVDQAGRWQQHEAGTGAVVAADDGTVHVNQRGFTLP